MAKMMYKGIVDQLMKITECHVEKYLTEVTMEYMKFHGDHTAKGWIFICINNIMNEHWSYDVNHRQYPIVKKLKFNKGGIVTINCGFIDQNGYW